MSQFEIITSQTNGVIEFNFEDLKRELTIAIEPYTTLVIAEDKIIEGKKTKAGLNNLKKSINDKKIEVKKGFMSPYEVFESQAKELMAIIDKAVVNLDDQVKAFDESKKAEKAEAITHYFIDQKFRTVSLDQLFDEKWLNATVSDKSWKEQLNGKIETIKADLALLENFNVEDKDLLKSFYLESLDMTSAKSRYDRIQASKAQVKIDTTQNTQEDNYTVKASVSPQTEPDDLMTRTFWVKGSLNQIIALGEYMNANNIAFGKVE